MPRLEAGEGSFQVTTRSVAAALRGQHLDVWRPTEELARYCEAYPDPMQATLTADVLIECLETLQPLVLQFNTPDAHRTRRARICEG